MMDYGGYFMKAFQSDTDDIPAETTDYQPVVIVPEPSSGGNDPGRLLSQSEIDALIAELTGG